MLFKIIVSVFIVIALIVNCGPDEIIEIKVSKGLNPTYSWNAGSVNSLRVRKGDSAVVWAIYTPNTDNIISPVIHGEIPKGAKLKLDPERIGIIDTAAYDKSLIHGEQYKILIMKTGEYSIGSTYFYADSLE